MQWKPRGPEESHARVYDGAMVFPLGHTKQTDERELVLRKMTWRPYAIAYTSLQHGVPRGNLNNLKKLPRVPGDGPRAR